VCVCVSVCCTLRVVCVRRHSAPSHTQAKPPGLLLKHGVPAMEQDHITIRFTAHPTPDFVLESGWPQRLDLTWPLDQMEL
jgi:hypothetical protein